MPRRLPREEAHDEGEAYQDRKRRPRARDMILRGGIVAVRHAQETPLVLGSHHLDRDHAAMLLCEAGETFDVCSQKCLNETVRQNIQRYGPFQIDEFRA